MRRLIPGRLTLAALVTTVAGIAACGDDGTGTVTESDESGDGQPPPADEPPVEDPLPEELVGREFLSETVTEDGEDRPLVEGTRIEISFPDEETIGISGGCNLASAPATVESGRLLVGDMEWTLRGCEPPTKHEQDDWLEDFLSAEPAYSIDDPHLTLEAGTIEIALVDSDAADTEDSDEADGDGQNGDDRMDGSGQDDRHTPDDPSTPQGGPSLPGTSWRVTGLVDGETTSPVPDDVDAVVTFEQDRIGIEACNTGGGAIEIGEAGIELEPPIMTMMACQGAVNDVEAALVAVLEGEVAYEIDGDALTLTHPNGRGVILTRRD